MKNITQTYIVALSIIALVIAFSQFLIQSSISNSSSDSRVINISGRQRMLSQKITKASLAMANTQSQSEFIQRKEELQAAYTLWNTSHSALQFGSAELQMENVNNSERILELFEEIAPHYEKMEAASTLILAANTYEDLVDIQYQNALKDILQSEGQFLKLMNDITFEYDAESTGRVSELSRNEYILFVIAILLLVAEALIIFRPAIRKLEENTKQILEHEKSLEKALGESQYLTNQAQSIFDNVRQGIFLLDSDLFVDTFYSKETENAFHQENLAGTNFVQIMKPRLKKRDLEALELFAENLFNTDIREDVVNRLNPIDQVEIFTERESDGGIESKFMRISFSRVMRGDEIYRVLVTVLDETESVLLRKQVEEAEERNKQESSQLLAVLKVNPKILNEYLERSIKSLSMISIKYESSKGQNYDSLVNYTFRIIHNAKGNATLINLDIIQDKLHKIEDLISELKYKGNIVGKDFLNIIYEVTEVIVAMKNMQVLLGKVANVYKTWTEDGVKQSSSDAMIATLKKGVARMSARLNKKINFEFEEKGTVIPDEYKLDTKDIFIQLIRNSIVHGIESIENRRFEGKPPEACIKITVDEGKDGGVVVSYEDDGRGLDLKKITAKAIGLGHVSELEVSKMSDSGKAELIFKDGFSTAAGVGTLAGRGHGMSLVKSTISKNYGSYKITSVEGEFFKITIKLPKVQQHELRQVV